MTTVQDARAALAAKAVAEDSVARLSVCPPWRHAAFAGIMTMLVASPAIAFPWRLGVLAVAFMAIVLVARSDRRRLGMFINGYRRGRTRWVTFPLLVVVMLLYGLSVYSSVDWHRPDLTIYLALASFVVCYAGSVIWQRVFVRELHG